MEPKTKAKAAPAPAPEKGLAVFDGFRAEIAEREEEIAKILPPNVSREKFTATALIAVKNNPELLQCERRSLHAAVTRAAEDGLQPDGREGVINVYNEKRKVRKGNAWVESWVKVAAWIPMVYGIRKRARELCGMIVDAQVVHENDEFEWHQGDDPRIDHKPTRLDEDPGKKIGVYAIFRQDGAILHREVMRKSEVEAIKSTVKAQNGLLWTKFESEAWRKSAVRRGIKTVPSVPDTLRRIVERDDDQYDFDRARTSAIESDEIPDPDLIPQSDTPELPAADKREGAPPDEPLADAAGVIAKLGEELEGVEDEAIRTEIWDSYESLIERMSDADRRYAENVFNGRGRR